VTLLNAIQLTWTFDLKQGTEDQDIAEFSLWFKYGPGGSAPQEDLDFLAQNGADAWSENVTGSNYGTNVTLRNVTARIFNAAGHTLLEAQKTPATAWAGLDSSGCLPWETSLCISLYTYTPNTFVVNGRRRRGRYYLPPMAASIMEGGNSGFMKATLLPTILAEQQDFYGHLYAGAFPGTLVVIPSVYSRVDEDLYIVEYLVADAKLDSQRRRENRETAGRIQLPIS
jgi:hypothetical protein